jgi:DNA polymerase III delta prime subunit
MMSELNLPIKNNLLHHAYCILGNCEDVMRKLENFFLNKLSLSIVNNPDFWYGEFDTMDIEDSRTIKSLHKNRPIIGDKKIFVVSANFITEKAQNAMLKLFEEPKGNTHFFLIVPSLNNIIPTFRSRLCVVDSNKTENSLINSKQFLSISVGERMEIVKKICGSISDEEESKIEIINLINSLEKELMNRVGFLNTKLNELAVLEEIEKIRQYVSEQSPSLKMLLEHVSLILPVSRN